MPKTTGYELQSHGCGVRQRRCETIGSPLPRNEREEYERNLAVRHHALGEEAFAAVWAEGEKMTLEQAVAYALEETEADQP